jgi:hypothetical protein
VVASADAWLDSRSTAGDLLCVGPPPPVIGPPQSNVPEPNPFAVITLVLITAIAFRKLRRGVVC